MPPRPSRSGSSRSGGGPLQAGRGSQSAPSQGVMQVGPRSANVVSTVGVRRPGNGSAGRKTRLLVNACDAGIPQVMIYHYDVAFTKDCPVSLARKLISKLQRETAPEIFQPVGAYDGKKNLFMPHKLDFGTDASEKPVTSKSFTVSLPREDPAKPPSVYSIKITKVAEVNPEILNRFVEGKQSEDEGVLTVLMVMNIVLGHTPKSLYPSNARSFFPGDKRQAVGHGLELWRGYFQSVRAAPGRVLLNFDITTGLVFKSGSLIKVALDFFNETNPHMLSPHSGLPDRARKNLELFVSGLHVKVVTATTGRIRTVVIRGLTKVGADTFSFDRDQGPITVANYFKEQGRNLDFPGIICITTQKGEVIPLEKCQVPEGQLARRQPPDEVVRQMVTFSQLKPNERMNAVKNGMTYLGHEQNELVNNFGMSLNVDALPMEIEGRVINPPLLKYGDHGKASQVNPRFGSWNLVDMKLIEAIPIKRWGVVIFTGKDDFSNYNAQGMIKDLIAGFGSVGMDTEQPFLTYYGSPQNVSLALEEAIKLFKQNLIHAFPKADPKTVPNPDLLVIVLPDAGNTAIYDEVKRFGDTQTGIPTQCLKASKCKRAKLQYWANVALKTNLKLGGINIKPDATSAAASGLCDPNTPTIVMGADVIHPPPYSTASSYAAAVANVDSDVARYIAETRMQESRQEIIQDLGGMVKKLLIEYMNYRMKKEKIPRGSAPPKRLLFFRDGVSAGQYEQVKNEELQLIVEACKELGIKPKITFVIVAKRHHFRFSPSQNTPTQLVDRSGNSVAGTVVDKDITHPIEFDFYLQAHGGLLGTSRAAHYHVLHDENKFSADGLHSLCYTLCHLFARSTKAIAIPAPVAYADIACARARASHLDGEYQPVHPNMARKGYFA